jgi:hypothetical protein
MVGLLLLGLRQLQNKLFSLSLLVVVGLLVGALCDVFRVNAYTEISRVVRGPGLFTVSSLPACASPCNVRQLKFENGLNSRFLKFGIYTNSKFCANLKFCSI